MRINSIVDFHDWKFTSRHWIPIDGRVSNACVRRLIYGLESPLIEELTMHVYWMCMLALVTLARVGKQLSEVKGH